MKHQAPAMT